MTDARWVIRARAGIGQTEIPPSASKVKEVLNKRFVGSRMKVSGGAYISKTT